MSDDLQAGMSRAAKWLHDIPDMTRLYQAVTVAALANEPDRTLSGEALELLYDEVASCRMMCVALYAIMRGDIRVCVVNGELAFRAANNAQAEAAREVGDG